MSHRRNWPIGAIPLCAALGLAVVLSLPWAPGGRADSGPARPNVIVVTVDTLRADRLSALGYERPTSPNIDRLIREGVNFAQARTVEPLTNPALTSMITSLPPYKHGATRNGLRLEPGLASLPRTLRKHGYRTAAFVGNWTLRDKLSGLAEHFDLYEEVLTKARWFGFIRREANAEDVTQATLEWVEEHLRKSGQPFLAWVHYVEPHAPYLLQKDHVEVLGDRGGRRGDYTKSERYDTEIAFVDAAIGRFLDGIAERIPPEETVIVFASDHGESLGEHNYWGHGRHLYEPTLRIPMAVHWAGRLKPTTIEAPAVNLDLAPTLLGLLDLPVPAEFEGYDWTGVLRGAPPPQERVTRYEAHKGAVISKHDSDLARKSGLLELAILQNDRKEILRLKNGRRLVFDLGNDPAETNKLVAPKTPPTEALQNWLTVVVNRLEDSDRAVPPETLDDESVTALRSLGYVD